MNLQSEKPLEGASVPPNITPANILNCAYMELLQWDDGRIFPEVSKFYGNQRATRIKLLQKGGQLLTI